MQQQIINEGAMNSGFGSKEVSNLNSRTEDRKYHAWEQAPQGFISVDLPPPEKGRMFTYFIIYVLCICRLSFPAFISEINCKVQTIMFSRSQYGRECFPPFDSKISY